MTDNIISPIIFMVMKMKDLKPDELKKELENINACREAIDYAEEMSLPEDYRVRNAIKSAEKYIKRPSKYTKATASSAAWSAEAAARSAETAINKEIYDYIRKFIKIG